MKKASPRLSALSLAMGTLVIGCNHSADQPYNGETSSGEIDRTILPIRPPASPKFTELDVKNTKAPSLFQVKAPENCPNVLVILIDDMGYGVSEAFGGPIPMPTFGRLAENGLRYSRFHTTALSAPTRTALLTGYNHHSAAMGCITEAATTYPGYTGVRPLDITPMAEVLRQNGFNTAQFGKSHEVPPWEISENGPKDRWPVHSGFEKFYGFLGGETNQWSPLVYDGLTITETPKDPDYHFTVDMTNQAIKWMRTQNSLQPDKPFFMYYAPGATHAPHHVPKEWIDRFRGKFDGGWDQLRAQTLERQKALGIVPQNTQLTRKPEGIKDWDALSSDEKKLFARQMEVYAAFAAHTDYEIGRLIDAIEATGELGNTVIIYIAGDNGSSAEGQMNGMFQEMTYFNQYPETVPDMMKHYDDWGSPSTYPHFAAGWAVALDAPFQYTKQVASDFGGTRNGMVIHWPAGVKAKGEIRNQFSHVIDIAPTVYEVAGIPAPKMVNGIKQKPIEGTSLVYSFNSGNAPERHTTQYFEMFGNRGIYHEGWLARTIHRAPWEFKPKTSLEENVWELYDTHTDFSLSTDLARENPDKLKELQAMFMKEAEKYSVLPIDDRLLIRTNAKAVGRPVLLGDRTSVTYYDGMHGLGVDIFMDLRNTSYSITADVEIDARGNGVMVCQGGRFGGLSFYIKDGRPSFSYNFLGINTTDIIAGKPLPAGKYKIVYDFIYDGNGLGKGGSGTISVNNIVVAKGRIERTQPGVFSVDDLADVGIDEGTHVAAYGGSSDFNGTLHAVRIEVKK